MTRENYVDGNSINVMPSSILRELWLRDDLSTEDYTAELRRRERAFISVSRDEVRALLLGTPKDQFTAALIRLATWLEQGEIA